MPKAKSQKPFGAALQYNMQQTKITALHTSLCLQITGMAAEETQQAKLESREK